MQDQSSSGFSVVESNPRCRPMRSILLMGASITEQGFYSNWASRLSNHYIRRADVINRGLSGYNTRMLLKLIKDPHTRPMLVPPHAIGALFVTLNVGSNDMATNNQGLSIEEYRRNLRELLELILREVKPVGGIFFFSVPPLDEAVYRSRQSPERQEQLERTFDRSREYCKACVEVVAQARLDGLDVYLVDVHNTVLQHCDLLVRQREPSHIVYDASSPWTNLFYDGLHFNDMGGEVMFSTLIQAVRRSRHAEKIEASRLPYALPKWEAML